MTVFRSHMGLGDHIICNAITRHFAKVDVTIVPVKRHNETSVKFMFSDDPNIRVVPFVDDKETDLYCRKMEGSGSRVIWNGNVGPAKRAWGTSKRNWDCRFYEQANLDFNMRWEGFRIPKNNFDWRILFHMRFPDLEPDNFIFLHNLSSIGPKQVREELLKDNVVFIPDIKFTDNIFDYVGLLQHAKEIHCIDSSFLCLVDSLDLKGELHYHSYARGKSPGPTLKRNWIVE